MPSQAEDLYARAYEMEPLERDAFLVEACGEDVELRLEVQCLLADAILADAYFGFEAEG